jgi:hypothetical protein
LTCRAKLRPGCIRSWCCASRIEDEAELHTRGTKLFEVTAHVDEDGYKKGWWPDTSFGRVAKIHVLVAEFLKKGNTTREKEVKV